MRKIRYYSFTTFFLHLYNLLHYLFRDLFTTSVAAFTVASLSLYFNPTVSQRLSLPLSYTHSLYLSLTHSHTHTLSHTLQLSLTHTHTLTFSHPIALSAQVLRQSPFDACLQILSGNKSPFEERYNAFFIDYSLLPLVRINF